MGGFGVSNVQGCHIILNGDLDVVVGVFVDGLAVVAKLEVRLVSGRELDVKADVVTLENK